MFCTSKPSIIDGGVLIAHRREAEGHVRHVPSLRHALAGLLVVVVVGSAPASRIEGRLERLEGARRVAVPEAQTPEQIACEARRGRRCKELQRSDRLRLIPLVVVVVRLALRSAATPTRVRRDFQPVQTGAYFPRATTVGCHRSRRVADVAAVVVVVEERIARQILPRDRLVEARLP